MQKSIEGCFALIVLFSVFGINFHITDPYLFSKWFATLAFMLIVANCFILISITHPHTICCEHLFQRINQTILFACWLLATTFLVLYAFGYHTVITHTIMGGVTGLVSCLSIGSSVAIFLSKRVAARYRYWLISLSLYLTLPSIFLQSRISIICLILSMTICNIQRIWVRLSLIPLLLLLLLIKTSSTAGRWFIYRRCFDMISEKPLWGWGTNGFAANYMSQQASYFMEHPDSSYSLLADNMYHPLNEFLLISINYGLVVTAILTILIIILLTFKRSKKNSFVGLGRLLIINILAFSLFTYPFSYPFTWVITLYAILMIICPQYVYIRCSSLKSGVLIVIIVLATYQLFEWWHPRKEWLYVINSNNGYTRKKTMNIYKDLYSNLRSDYRFLYNYACELYFSEDYENAQIVINECNKLLVDYDLSILSGDIELAQGNYKNATQYYINAHYMCPCRFLPLCNLYDLYKLQGDRKKCRLLRNEILSMPIKIRSDETLQLIRHVKEDDYVNK